MNNIGRSMNVKSSRYDLDTLEHSDRLEMTWIAYFLGKNDQNGGFSRWIAYGQNVFFGLNG